MIMAKPGAIQLARAAKGWTQTELSENSGVSRQSIGMIEKRKAGASPKSAKKICEILEREIDDLFEGE